MVGGAEEAADEFTIALIHSPEAYDLAAECGVDLYLCGHTHGGQICLPFGIPILTHLRRGRKYVYGAWKYENMQGYTTSGTGCSGIPVRFNTHSEIVIHQLSMDNRHGE